MPDSDVTQYSFRINKGYWQSFMVLCRRVDVKAVDVIRQALDRFIHEHEDLVNQLGLEDTLLEGEK